jgi:zinc/manganese transport system permease protein
VSIAASYQTNWPVGFFVGVGGAACYALGRGWAFWSGSRRSPGSAVASGAASSGATAA